MTKWVKSKCNKYVRIVIMEILDQEIKLCNYMYSPQNWLIYISLTWGNKVILFCFNFRFMPITNLLKETYLGLELELVLYKVMICIVMLSLKIKTFFFVHTFLKKISVLYIIFRSIFINGYLYFLLQSGCSIMHSLFSNRYSFICMSGHLFP